MRGRKNSRREGGRQSDTEKEKGKTNPCHLSIQVVVHLTKEGQERWKDVAALVHAHTRLVRELPADDARRAWQESRDMGAIYLRFQQARARVLVFCLSFRLAFSSRTPCGCRLNLRLQRSAKIALCFPSPVT